MSNLFASVESAVNTAALAALGNATAVLGAATVYGVFDDRYADPLGISASSPAFTALAADVSTATIGGSISVDSISYTVTAIEPDGTGLTVLRLQEA